MACANIDPDPEEALSECEPQDEAVSQNITAGAVSLRGWLNKSLRIQMFDGRVLIGAFLCTDRDANVILGSCTEYLPAKDTPDGAEEPRMLGLVMVPGKHISSVAIDESPPGPGDLCTPLSVKSLNSEDAA